jgi:hypothetical protein
MIYLCQNCGWSINSRYCDSTIKPEEVGKHLLYNHLPFCSETCIESAKNRPFVLKRQVHPSDWDDQNWTENGRITNWRIERKLKRMPRPKNRKAL